MGERHPLLGRAIGLFWRGFTCGYRALCHERRASLRTGEPKSRNHIDQTTVPEADGDPTLEPFLHFLAQDIAQHPEHLQTLDASLLQRVQTFTQGMAVDLDAPLSADDE